MRPLTNHIRRGLRDLAPAMYRERAPLTNLRVLPLGPSIPPQAAPIPAPDAPGWLPIAPGARWGGQDENAWFHGEVAIPASWRAKLRKASWSVALRLLLGSSSDFGWPEGLLYINGALLQGVNQHHPDALLPNNVLAPGALTVDVRAWSGMSHAERQLEYAEIALLSRDIEALYYLLNSGVDLVDALEERDPLLYPLAATLEDAYNTIDLRRPHDRTLDTSAAGALATLRQRLATLRATHDPAQRPRVTAIGHGHLDVAWLWQTRHTREKAARTFSVATALMDLYPDYYFLHTTPQVYDWLARDYPKVFARVLQRVAEGRFEAAGAMWLESDTNLVSGESLVRQIAYGQRYLRETFGAEYDVLWLPDTFGYTYALPQIMLKSGLRAFMTTKLSWSDTNRLPHDTFRWRGLDGSETLAHFVTTPWLPLNPDFDTDTYNGQLDVASVRQVWERYRDKAHNQDLLLVFGHGDGGAGPTRQHLESYRAMKELPGMPDLRLGRADDYFRTLRDRVWKDPALPVWDGELYLEYHRGVYTTQAWLKRLHRRLEERLLLAETLDATRWARAFTAGDPVVDGRPALDDAWRTLLLHEFHDILPGSSIGAVYQDARIALTDLAARLDTFIALAERDVTSSVDDGWLVHNPSPCGTPGGPALALLPLDAGAPLPMLAAEGQPIPAQEVISPEGARFALIRTPKIAARGWLALTAASTPFPQEMVEALAPAATSTPEGGATLENGAFCLIVNPLGEIVSLIDKRGRGREVIAAGQVGNQFIAFDDRPLRFDAWDIDAGYERKQYAMDAATVTVTESGPLRATVHVTRRFLSSVIEQDISLHSTLWRIDFATRASWHERHLLLKAAFPLDLRATQARSEIQYGFITRPTHANTSWDEARFETVAHRWVDLCESGYGVALLNDGRYGHDIHGSTIRLTILRSPTSPDPDADQGPHEVTFSLLPYTTLFDASRVFHVVAHGYALNRPLRALPGRGVAPAPLFSVDGEQVIIEAIKRAAEGDDLTVRLYEAIGSRALARVACAYPLARVVECDLLERPLDAASSPAYDLWRDSPAASHDAPQVSGSEWTCAFRPFEIRTFRVTLARP